MLPMTPMAMPINPDQPQIDALVTLHTRTVDSGIGYEKMLEKAEPEFRATVQRFHAVHAAHAGILAGMLGEKGYQVDGDGSIMGSINRAVVAVRSFFDDVDADLLTAIHDGEQHVLQAFADAIAQPLTPADISQLTDMRDELVTLLAQHPARS